jgi:hypothetical protein
VPPLAPVRRNAAAAPDAAPWPVVAARERDGTQARQAGPSQARQGEPSQVERAEPSPRARQAGRPQVRAEPLARPLVPAAAAPRRRCFPQSERGQHKRPQRAAQGRVAQSQFYRAAWSCPPCHACPHASTTRERGKRSAPNVETGSLQGSQDRIPRQAREDTAPDCHRQGHDLDCDRGNVQSFVTPSSREQARTRPLCFESNGLLRRQSVPGPASVLATRVCRRRARHILAWPLHTPIARATANRFPSVITGPVA